MNPVFNPDLANQDPFPNIILKCSERLPTGIIINRANNKKQSFSFHFILVAQKAGVSNLKIEPTDSLNA
jgi:hypothetical protein